MTQSVLVTLEEKVMLRKPDGAGRANRTSYVLPNGSEIVVGGLDLSSRIMSTEYDTVYIAEATEVDEGTYDDLDTRIRNNKMPYQRMIIDCNPSYPSHWILRRAMAGRMVMLDSKHTDNPSCTPEYLQALQRLTGVRRKRLYEGLWVSAEGAIYPEFGAHNMVDAMPAGWEIWPKTVGIDFGYTNPSSIQWWAISPDNEAYLYREWYHTETHTATIGQLLKQYEYERPHPVSVDHDAQDRATLASMLIPTHAAKKDVMPGIEHISRRLQERGNGRRGLYILKGCLLKKDERLVNAGKPASLVDEITQYTWMDGKDAPVKANDHACDAMRYALYSYSKLNWLLNA
jgi:phage terminase large subunit